MHQILCQNAGYPKNLIAIWNTIPLLLVEVLEMLGDCEAGWCGHEIVTNIQPMHNQAILKWTVSGVCKAQCWPFARRRIFVTVTKHNQSSVKCSNSDECVAQYMWTISSFRFHASPMRALYFFSISSTCKAITFQTVYIFLRQPALLETPCSGQICIHIASTNHLVVECVAYPIRTVIY